MAPKNPMTSSGMEIPASAYERMARFLLPRIQAYFESEEGQREFAKWKAEQAEQEASDPDKPSGCMAA